MERRAHLLAAVVVRARERVILRHRPARGEGITRQRMCTHKAQTRAHAPPAANARPQPTHSQHIFTCPTPPHPRPGNFYQRNNGVLPGRRLGHGGRNLVYCLTGAATRTREQQPLRFVRTLGQLELTFKSHINLKLTFK